MELPAAYQSRVDALAEAVLAPGRLPERVKHLAIALAYTNKGCDEPARRHAQAALDAGLVRPEVVEALAATVLSRGFWMLEANKWLVDAAPEGPWDLADRPPTAAAEIRDYFAKTFGSVPVWLERLAATAPKTLEAYHALRAEALRDAALARVHKELLLVVINAAERYEFGMKAHMRGALEAGASSDDIYEAVNAAIAPGGVVAWIAGAEAAEEVLAPGAHEQ
jgi:alkylhydroperoxidase/carboxymuconolactone decarboxylase family protein YurZ